MSSILDQPAKDATPPYAQPVVPAGAPAWQHPDSEAERLLELEDFLFDAFETYPQVPIKYQWMPGGGRVDLLAIPKLPLKEAWDRPARPTLDVALAFEVKGKGFDLERALKQSADYVGGRVLEGPHRGKSIAACFLYPIEGSGHRAVFNLMLQWRVGRGFVNPRETRPVSRDRSRGDLGQSWLARHCCEPDAFAKAQSGREQARQW